MTLTQIHENLAGRSFSDNAICEFCLSTITTGQRDRDELISTCTQCAVRKSQMPKDTNAYPAHRSAADAIELDTFGYIDRRPVATIEHEERKHGGIRRAAGIAAGDLRHDSPPTTTKRTCSGCGKTITASRSDAAYCNSTCRSRNARHW